MIDQTETVLVRAPEIPQVSAGDPFFEHAQEITGLITRRAYELFASSGFTHGHDREDWIRAASEVLCSVPVDVTETEDQVTVRAEVAGFTEKNIEVRVEPRSLCITGKRREAWEQKEGNTVYSERRASQIFRVLDLPSRIDPEKVNAKLGDGVLEIILAKVGTGKKIPVLTKAASA
jgi:HSP20 family protein